MIIKTQENKKEDKKWGTRLKGKMPRSLPINLPSRPRPIIPGELFNHCDPQSLNMMIFNQIESSKRNTLAKIAHEEKDMMGI